MSNHHPHYLSKLITMLRKLPGIGFKGAERVAFHVIGWPKDKQIELSRMLENITDHLFSCNTCGCLIESNACKFCDPISRTQKVLCVLVEQKDVFSIEETGFFKGYYHVLNASLSPIRQKTIEDSIIKKLKNRAINLQIEEIVLALDSTLEGDATALYLKKHIESLGIPISRLASGLPMGIFLDYVDEGTLTRAFMGRSSY
ncbi:recombination mediator RecR [Candidatus Clavichlamydia salmonicola]|uniref:recombination mediator RecR n=1 Tax=Candidatus Clavichlamydia salmonicola TaxID=469812 RepID=UPI0018913425|nr:recombination mediator RecR [Candidatus Clavichlamydia salmonicola]